MSQRIMMHVAGGTRPLSFGAGFDETPSLDSARTGWSGLPVEQHRLMTWEGDVEAGPVSGESGILVYLSGSVQVDAKLGGLSISRRLDAGDASFMTGDDRHRYQRIQGDAEALVVHLPSEWLTRALGGNRATPFDRTVALGKQPTLVSLARELQAEVNRRGQTGRLFAESLSLAFVGFAASQLNPSTGKDHGRSLGPTERRKLRDFMLSHLAEDVSLSELAAVVGLGPRHFSKLFGSAFGCSPYRYVLNLRLAEAARLLTSTSRDVREIAYELGFCSQSHFTAMFRKAYGLTPARYGSGRRSTTI
jgi:AraC-like DNA-binding protein